MTLTSSNFSRPTMFTLSATSVMPPMSELSLSMSFILHHRYIVYVNGKPIGFTKEPNELAAVIRGLRRSRYLSEFVSVHCKIVLRCVHVVSDGGRLCRPYIIVCKGKPLVTQSMLDVRLCLLNLPSYISSS